MTCKKPNTFEPDDDQVLIQRILAGDAQAAAELLIERCGSRLKFLCACKFAALELEFDELVSETYELLSAHQWKALQEFRGMNAAGQSCKLENYISLIVSRYLYKKMDRRLKELAENSPLFEWENTPFDGAADEQRQASQEVMEAIQALENPREREVLLRYKLGGESPEALSEQMGISVANLYTLTHRAMTHLRAILEGRGIYG